MKKNWLQLIAFSAFLFFIFLVRLKYHQGAIETDIGSYAYGAQQLMRGKMIYVDFFDHKPPGIYLIYLMIFKAIGQSTQALKATASVMVFLNSCLVFLIARKVISKKAGLGAMILYLLSMSLPFLQGAYANTETFMVFFILLANSLILYTKYARARGTVFLSGFLLGLATLIKTVAISNISALLLWFLLTCKKNQKKIISPLLTGFALPILVALLFLARYSTLSEFWFANITFNQVYLSRVSLIERLLSFPSLIFLENPGLWIIGAFGLIRLTKNYPKLKNKKGLLLVALNIVLIIPLFFSLGRRCPHYYIQIVPFFVVMAGYAWHLGIRPRKTGQLIAFGFLALIPLLFLVNVLFFVPPQNLANYIQPFGRGDWYDQSRELAKYISGKVEPGDYIYNLGRESQIYFYTQTQSPTRFYYDRPFWFFPETIDEACHDLAQTKANCQYSDTALFLKGGS